VFQRVRSLFTKQRKSVSPEGPKRQPTSPNVNFDSSRDLWNDIGSPAGWSGEPYLATNVDVSAVGRLRFPPHLERGLVSKTTILLADDNSSVLAHVSKMLEKEKDCDVVAAISNGTTVVCECLRLRPNVIILDISMGELSGIDVARELRDSGCTAKIIFLTVHEDRDYMNAAMGAGGSAYVVKSRLSLDLFSAISAVLSNKLFVSANLLNERP
jgi:CheY-like chemotaxis protein